MTKKTGKHNPTQGHSLFIVLYTLAILLGYLIPGSTPIILIIYMIIASIKILLKNIHIILLFFILSIATLIFPILFFVEFFLALYFIARRINFFLRNIHAVMLGLFIYIAPIIFSISILNINISEEDKLYYFLATAASLSLISHFNLQSLYKKGYSFEKASEIMAISPLLVISLILPILKLELIFGDTIEIGGDTVEVGETDIHSQTNPHTHEVSEYIRTSPNGNIQEVSGYIRTNPDGIVENNLSYHSNTLHSTNSNIHAGGDIRTIPQGITEVFTVAEGYKQDNNQKEIEKGSPVLISAQQKKQKLKTALYQLPLHERKLLIMIYGQRRDLQSVAYEYGYTLHELKSHIEQAVKQLQYQIATTKQS